MNPDAMIFSDNQECLQYINTVPESPQKKKPSRAPTIDSEVQQEEEQQKTKKESLNYAHPRFVITEFQLYETKTVRL
jgi:hypothetical protein